MVNFKTSFKVFLFMLSIMGINKAFAQDSLSVKGINFIVFPDSKEASVIAKDGGYEGSVNIPATLTIEYEPYKVTGINTGAFSNCPKLKEVIIPESMLRIQENAFTDVPQGLNLYINKSNVIGFVKNAFDKDCFEKITVHLPTESILKSYKRSGTWCNFKNTGIVPKSKSDGIDRRKDIEKQMDSKRFKTGSKSRKIVY